MNLILSLFYVGFKVDSIILHLYLLLLYRNNYQLLFNLISEVRVIYNILRVKKYYSNKYKFNKSSVESHNI